MRARNVTQEIQVADQPDLSDFQALVSTGFRGVVNLRQDGEPEQPLGPEREGEEVRALGLGYLHCPMGGTPLTREMVEGVSEFIEGCSKDGGRVLVHCRKGGRAIAMVLLALARQEKWNPGEVIAEGQELGLVVDGPLRMIVEDYLQREGTA